LFWRKKNKTEKAEALFTYDDTCRRGFVRVRPLPASPVTIDFGGEKVELEDISAGGLACRCRSARAGEVHQVSFKLPGEEVLLSGQLEILAVTDDGICHCRFRDLSPEAADAIHKYALMVQKIGLQEQMKRRENLGLP
jgi:hypothetical protein